MPRSLPRNRVPGSGQGRWCHLLTQLRSGPGLPIPLATCRPLRLAAFALAVTWLVLLGPGLGAASRAALPDLAADAAPRQVTPASRILGGEEVQVLRDPGGRLRIDDLAAPGVASGFKPIGRGLGIPYSEDAIWLRLQLRRAAAEPVNWRLELTSAFLNDVRLFEPLPGGGYREGQAGDRHPFAERPVPHRRPVFDIHLPDESPRIFHLRLQSDSTLMMTLVLWEARAFDAALQRDTLWIGALAGIVLISTFFFLQAWAVNRDRLLAEAVVATLLFGMAAAANLGLLGQYLLPEAPVWADLLQPLSIVPFFLMLTSIFHRSLDVQATGRWFSLLRWFPVALYGTAVTLKLMGRYGPWGGPLLMLGMLLALAWITAAAWLTWRAQGRGPYVALSVTVFTALFAGAPLSALGVLPPTQHFDLFWAVSCVGFILMAQITTLEEVRRARAQRREAARNAATARRQAEQEAAWRRQQTQYFVGVAHDLRTPLSALRVGLANLQRMVSADKGEVVDKLMRLDASCRRVADMIDLHLQLQRLEHPDLVIERAPVAVADGLTQIETMLAEAWPQVRLRVLVRHDAPQLVAIDRELVARALGNLVTNAAKAAPPETAVELEAAGDGEGGVRFLVRDRGPGLGDVSLEALVQMHWRRPRGRQDMPGAPDASFGIGLPVVHRVALLHQGQLSYRREPQGVTVFELWLPVARPTSDP